MTPAELRARAYELDCEADALIRNATELKQQAGILLLDADEQEEGSFDYDMELDA